MRYPAAMQEAVSENSRSCVPGIHDVLSSLFGFRAFRPHQEAVIRAVLDGRDSFTLMPTGGGKSLCYQLPARLLPGVCVVVCPLISLMKDQVDAALGTGLRAAAYNSACTAQEKDDALRGLREGSLDLLYVSPERLRLPGFAALLKQSRLSFFAIDEAHCISEWGHDFRPDYLALSHLREEFSGLPLAAFTATATRQVERDIIERLGLRKPLRTRASFNRPNLFYQVTPKEDAEEQLLAFVRAHAGASGIIYRTTRKNVEATAACLNRNGIKALAYHAGLADKERRTVQEAFRQDACPVIVATIAFGMGIDKPDVRFVAHGDLPKNLEGYYQESGRAGRDGEPARCALFYGRGDIAQLMRFAEAIADESARAVAKQQLYRMLDFTQKEGCRRKALLAYFGEELPEDNCGACDVCTGEVGREDASVAAQKLLSAMVRTGNRFGARHIINIVMGKNLKRIRELGHDTLPTFGVGSDKDAVYWHKVMDALLAQGLAASPDPAFPVPVVTEAGWEVLRGERPCTIIRSAEQKKEAQSGTAGADASPLFALLREERMRLARGGNIPPFAVCSNRSLREMVEKLPEIDREFIDISGVGQHKLAAYGESFLALIRRWLAEHPEEQARKAACAAPDAAGRPFAKADESRTAEGKTGGGKAAKGASARETGLLLDAGRSLEEAAAERGLALGTVCAHLEQLVREGKRYSPSRFMDPPRLAYFRRLFEASGGWRLQAVVEQSRADAEAGTAPGGPASYEEARLARLFLADGPGDKHEEKDKEETSARA